jgi:predicted DNA-binding protein (UPF0251 family)
MTPPKGKRKSNAETYRDAMAVAKLVDVDGLEVGDAAASLGLTRSTTYRLLSRARSLLLREETEANKKAAEPVVNKWFEPIVAESAIKPEPVSEVPEMKLPDIQPVTAPVPEDDDPWPWEHLMSHAEFMTRDPWRQKQLVAQWMENVALGGKHSLTLRGGPKNKNCFRGCPSYECLCEENL